MWLLAACAHPDPAPTAPGDDWTGVPGVCVGEADVDQGEDGVVDQLVRSVLGPDWSEVEVWALRDLGSSQETFQELDPLGNSVLKRVTWRQGLEVTVQETAWDRDADGRALGWRVVDGPSAAYTYDGEQLVRLEVDLDHDGTPDQTTSYTYDDQGRPATEVFDVGSDHGGTPKTSVYTWLDAANYHRDDDLYDDGTVDLTQDVRLDDAGRSLETVLFDANRPFTSDVTSAYDDAGRLVRQVEVDVGSAGSGSIESTWRYDADGHELESTRDQDGRVDRTLWSWSCE